MIPALTPSEIARFRARIDVGDNCWTWTGELNGQGYGRFVIYRKRRVRILAHRLSYFLETGEDPGDLIVRHGCDNPPCVRIDHLKLGTQLDNQRDATLRGRADRSGLAVRHALQSAQVLERIAAGMKTCCVCEVERPFEEFHRHREKPDGRQPICKECRRITGGVSETQRRRLLADRRRAA